uniref:Uncharacterized protein n=1 Tax=viral metagenome TaxID=1070528 RepID=A0A6C0ANS4_9ZZZZ
MKQSDRFCRCIKAVKKTVKLRPAQHSDDAREKAAIAICVKSVLQSRGRTLKKFKCRGKGKGVHTQKIK